MLLMGYEFDRSGCYIEFMDGHRERWAVIVYSDKEELEDCADG